MEPVGTPGIQSLRVELKAFLAAARGGPSAATTVADDGPLVASSRALADRLKGCHRACEADLGGGSVSVSYNNMARLPSFATVHAILSDIGIILGLTEALCVGCDGDDGARPWLRVLRQRVDSTLGEGNEGSPNERHDVPAPGSSMGISSEGAIVGLGKAIVLFLSDGIIALQGSRPFAAAFDNAAQQGGEAAQDSSATLPQTVIHALCEAMGAAGHLMVPFIGQLVRVLSKLRVFMDASFAMCVGGGGEEGGGVHVGGGSCCALLSLLALVASTSDACVIHETWACIRALMGNKTNVSAFVVESLDVFAAHLVKVLRVPSWLGGGGQLPAAADSKGTTTTLQLGGWYVNGREALRLLAALLGDPSYGKARTRLADCPALLAATLSVIGVLQQRRLQPSGGGGGRAMGAWGPTADVTSPPSNDGPLAAYSHDLLLLNECYHVLKVYVAKPKKALSVRFLLVANRDAVLHFIMDYHSLIDGDGGGGGGGGGADADGDDDDGAAVHRDAEKKLLITALCRTEPLDADEIYTLRHFLHVSAPGVV